MIRREILDWFYLYSDVGVEQYPVEVGLQFLSDYKENYDEVYEKEYFIELKKAGIIEPITDNNWRYSVCLYTKRCGFI